MIDYSFYNIITGEITSTYSSSNDIPPTAYSDNIAVIEGFYTNLDYYIKNGIPIEYTTEQKQRKKAPNINRALNWSNETFSWTDL